MNSTLMLYEEILYKIKYICEVKIITDIWTHWFLFQRGRRFYDQAEFKHDGLFYMQASLLSPWSALLR